jgi:hypothetical protein
MKLHNERPIFRLVPSPDSCPGQIQIQCSHHIEPGVIFENPKLRSNARIEIEQLVFTVSLI